MCDKDATRLLVRNLSLFAAGASYRREHVIASVTERLTADLLQISWNRYGAEVASK